MVSTSSQSIVSPSVNSQPRQKLAKTAVGKIVGWATPNSAPSSTLASWMPRSDTPGAPWRQSTTCGVSPSTMAWPK